MSPICPGIGVARHMAGVPTGHVFRVQEWMGHADIQTTMRYLHFAPRDEDAGWSPRRSQSNRCDPRKSHDFQAEVQDVRRWPRDAGLRPTRGIVGGIGCPVSAGNSRGTGRLGRLGQHPVRGVCLRCSGAVATRVPLLQRGRSRTSLPMSVGPKLRLKAAASAVREARADGPISYGGGRCQGATRGVPVIAAEEADMCGCGWRGGPGGAGVRDGWSASYAGTGYPKTFVRRGPQS